MALSAIALSSRALLKLGAQTIDSFEDGSSEAEIAKELYAPIRDALLASQAWSFAQAYQHLARLDEVPAADYGYAFALPSDFLRAIAAGTSGYGRGLEYRIIGRALYCNSETVTLSYIRRPDETDFPAFFDLALIARLAAEFCLPLTESTSRTQLLLAQAEIELRRARSIDAQQDSQPGFEDFSLITARY
jgi:hypothetical protein